VLSARELEVRHQVRPRCVRRRSVGVRRVVPPSADDAVEFIEVADALDVDPRRIISDLES
jgi:hypothetical protein